jgi:hypothetical protein
MQLCNFTFELFRPNGSFLDQLLRKNHHILNSKSPILKDDIKYLNFQPAKI